MSKNVYYTRIFVELIRQIAESINIHSHISKKIPYHNNVIGVWVPRLAKTNSLAIALTTSAFTTMTGAFTTPSLATATRHASRKVRFGAFNKRYCRENDFFHNLTSPGNHPYKRIPHYSHRQNTYMIIKNSSIKINTGQYIYITKLRLVKYLIAIAYNYEFLT